MCYSSSFFFKYFSTINRIGVAEIASAFAAVGMSEIEGAESLSVISQRYFPNIFAHDPLVHQYLFTNCDLYLLIL